RIWCEHVFPDSWRVAIVLPFPKPGKDPAIPSNYRPIALTSCLCKLLERMVNARLMWFLETNKILSPHQCGFRRHRSSIDHLLRLETSIREAFVRRQHLVSVFFDLEKAYDRAWRYGILRDLHGCGLRGNLPLFIEGFLQNRRFRVRVGSTLSSYFPQEEGVPQGSVLSVTLFILRINDIFRQLPLTVRATGFVDDLQIFCSSVNMGLAERQLQSAISKLSSWTLRNGFVFSSQKTVCVHFCRKRGLHPDPSLRLGPSSIRVVPETKFLGVYLDRALTFRPH
ncbi:reverse transcriptase family protein, partial [Salmonella enterica subsp. enterica serovar Typhimurium]|nr:reverse transcriptase family protein [Salmonella enterica subsp. enterica serovar Typhimurium]